jgi:hypothetical protein
MNPNARYPYCKPYWSNKEPNNFGYPVSLTQLGYSSQKLNIIEIIFSINIY